MRSFDRWIFHSYVVTPEGLGLYRIAYAAFVLLVIAPGHSIYTSFANIGQFPDLFFNPPPGPMALFSGFPSVAALEVLVFALDLSLVALLVGYRTRLASVSTCLLFLVGYGFSYSFGKINHTLLFALLPAVMMPSNWGAALSVDAAQGRDSSRQLAAWPITFLAMLVGFGMFTAGFTKLIGGWLDPSTHATLGHFIRQYYTNGRQDLLAPYMTTVDNRVLWEAMDYVAVAFEMGFLVAILSRRTTRFFAAFAVCFHACIALIMNIAFVENLIVYAAFINWSEVRSPRGTMPDVLARPAVVLPVILGLSMFFFLVGSPLMMLDKLVPLSSGLAITELLALGVGLVVVGAATLTCLGRARAHLAEAYQAART